MTRMLNAEAQAIDQMRAQRAEQSQSARLHAHSVQRRARVRFGSIADIWRFPSDVRFPPKSGHVRCNRRCPLWANSGHDPIQAIDAIKL
jgi:hypothetical protein